MDLFYLQTDETIAKRLIHIEVNDPATYAYNTTQYCNIGFGSMTAVCFHVYYRKH